MPTIAFKKKGACPKHSNVSDIFNIEEERADVLIETLKNITKRSDCTSEVIEQVLELDEVDGAEVDGSEVQFLLFVFGRAEGRKEQHDKMMTQGQEIEEGLPRQLVELLKQAMS